MLLGNLTDRELFQAFQKKKIKFTALTQPSIKRHENLINDLDSAIDHSD